MPRAILGLVALLLVSCGGGGEVYPVPSTQAYLKLSSIGTPPAMDPLPGGLSPVSVTFEVLSGENSVQWLFTHEGDDIGRIVARVTPDGPASTHVTVTYVKGTAADGNWRNAQVRQLIETQVQKLVVEAVDSTLENRSFDDNLRKQVAMDVTTSSVGSMLNDISASADEVAAEEKERERQKEDAASASPDVPINPDDASKPMTDLSKFNNGS
jgi:ribosomal protein L12E/L44/L45/RPP1/RPP2